MGAQQAASILKQAGEWPQQSYISPEDADAIFEFNGKLKVSESARLGDTANISNVLIKPEDNSFDHIRLAITKGGNLIDQFQAMASVWQPSATQPQNPFKPVVLSNGTKGYCDDHGTIVARSPDGRFDITIEVVISDNGRDSINVTNSNKNLIDGVTNGKDRGFKFLTDAMTRIVPMAEQKYQKQVKARAEIEEAMDFLAKMSPPTMGTFGSSNVAKSSPVDSASPSPAPSSNAVLPTNRSHWFLVTIIVVFTVGIIGCFALRRRKPQ